ncbi:MAG TPA: OFA family MFS transporter [Terriglobales bacterium]
MATAKVSPSELPQAASISRWWRVVGGLSMNLALGSLYAWSLFVPELSKDPEFKMYKLTDFTLTFTIAVVVFALTFVVAGRIQDKKGPLICSIIGGVLVSLGFYMSGHAHSLTALYFWFGAIGGLGNGFGYCTPIPVMAKWFPDRRGLAVGLAVAGYGGGSAIFGKLALNYLIPAYGWRSTFEILGGIFLVMTLFGAFLLKNPPAGYRPAGWSPAPATSKAAATTYEFTPAETLRTPTFYFMWVAYALGCSAGLMVISVLIPFFKESLKNTGMSPADIAGYAGTAFIVGAVGNAAGRILSGWMSDGLGRINVLRLMIGISMVAMPILYLVGGSLGLLFTIVFVVYWCYGTQLSVNGSAASDFWGTKNAGINYGMLFTAWGVAGIVGPMLGAKLRVAYNSYQVPFYTAAVLAAVALLCELAAKRPQVPAEARGAAAKAVA